MQVSMKPPTLQKCTVREYATRVRSIRGRLAEQSAKVKSGGTSGAGVETAFGIGKGVAAGGAAVGKSDPENG